MGWLERQCIRTLEPLLRSRKRGESHPPAKDGTLQFADSTPFYGQRCNSPLLLTAQDRLRHIAMFGGSGSGKSWSVISWLLLHISSGLSCVLIDVHDTGKKLLKIIAREVAAGRMPRSVLTKVQIVDLAYLNWITPLNPLCISTPLEANLHANAMFDILEAVWPDVTWGSRTKELTRNMLLLLSERGLSLADIEPLLRDPASLRAHAQQISNVEAKNFFLHRYLQMSRSMQLVYSEALLNKVTVFLSDPRIRDSVGAQTNVLDIRASIDSGKVIIIDLNKGEFLSGSAVVGSFELNALKKAVFSRINVEECNRPPTSVFVEEFSSFASVVTIEPFLNEGRKFGAGMVLVAQSPASLDSQLWRSIRTNCLTQVYFRMSPEDAKLACSGFRGEERELAMRRVTSLDIGQAMLLKGGAGPKILSFPKLTIPNRLSQDEERLIDQMRRNIGHPPRDASPQGDFLTPNAKLQRPPQNGPLNNREPRLSLPDGYRDGSAS